MLSVLYASPANTLFTAGYAYGLRTFQTSSTDADLGSQSDTIDALGELLNYQDAKGQSFIFTYDALSRPKTRTESDLTTTWTWGNSAASFNIGSLQSVSSVDSVGMYSETYVYDSKTRPSTQTIVIPGDATYVYTQTYNATTGLPDTLTYPVSTASFKLKLQYGYTNGILSKISDFTSGTAYWTANTMNERGQYAQETLGNGVVVAHDFDAMRGWPNSIKAGPGGGSALQNNGYAFDAMGNLTQRQDNNQGLTENFNYDGLYRLMNSTLNGVADESRTYDVTGNVLSWSVFGATVNTMNYTTPQTSCTYYANSQPHAYRSNTQGSFVGSACYDANGNTTTQGFGSSMTWTSYNQPSFVNSGFGPASNFYYNANHQRYKQVANYAGPTETTIYVGDLVEKVSNSSGTFYRQYIPADNNLVLSTLTASTGANTTNYITQDHLGSLAVVTNSTGGLVLSENFSGYGILRGPTWGSSGQPDVSGVSRKGFTGQETVIGGIDLNGRLLNNSNGRMYSPDPFVPNPGNTQSFNRYSYVNNNPLSFVDPSGFEDEPPNDPITTIVVISTFLGGQSNIASGNFYSDLNFSMSGKALEATGLRAGSKLPSAAQNPGIARPQNSANASKGPQVAAVSLDIGPIDFASPDVGALVGPAPSVSIADPASGPGGGGGGSGGAGSISEFNAFLKAEAVDIHSELGQSKNYPAEIAAFEARPSFLSRFGQDLASDVKKHAPAIAMTAAAFTPIGELGDLVIGAREANVVYRSIGLSGDVQYVGITNSLARRAAEHLTSSGFKIEKLLGGLSRSDARAVEQALIEIHGIGRNGGTLLNRLPVVGCFASRAIGGYRNLWL